MKRESMAVGPGGRGKKEEFKRVPVPVGFRRNKCFFKKGTSSFLFHCNPSLVRERCRDLILHISFPQ